MTFFGFGWAQPATRRRWAVACSLLQLVKRGSGYRVGNHAFGYAFDRATS